MQEGAGEGYCVFYSRSHSPPYEVISGGSGDHGGCDGGRGVSGGCGGSDGGCGGSGGCGGDGGCGGWLHVGGEGGITPTKLNMKLRPPFWCELVGVLVPGMIEATPTVKQPVFA